MKLCEEILCTGCGACASACPLNCISIEKNDNGFFVPVINESKCVNCSRCREVCPVINPETPLKQEKKFYAGWSKAKKNRIESSSGGLFGVFADYIINQKKGVVFGAAFSDNYKGVMHTNTDEVPLDKLKQSKYVESYMGLTCRKVEEYLKADRWVLFCGTPCQVMGIRKYLNYDYEKLILCDFFCHGVPSNKVYYKYLEALEKKMKRKISQVEFRSKELGWKTYCMKIIFEDGSRYLKISDVDPYYRMFFKNICLRKPCYSCNRVSNSLADVTIGDFWGVTKLKNIPDTDEGISIIAINTQKGRKMFDAVQNKIIFEKIRYTDVAYAYKKRNIPSHQRDEFFNKLNNGTFDFWNNNVLPRVTYKDKIKNLFLRYKFFRTLLRLYRFAKHVICINS